MRLIPRLIILSIACVALLVGIQIPNFIDQYQKRVDAHLREVKIHLRAFQQIADQYDGGSIEALIARHERSADPAFQAEALPIRRMQDRYRRFAAQWEGLQAPLPRQILVILRAPDQELLDETWAQYSFAILLNLPAVATGIALTAVAVLLAELLGALLHRFRPLRSR